MAHVYASPAQRRGDAAPTFVAIAFVLLAVALFSAMDALSKILAATYDPVEVVWGRYLAILAMLAPLVLRDPRALVTARPALQLARGLTVLGAALLFIAGLARLPIADATAIGFASPLLVKIAFRLGPAEIFSIMLLGLLAGGTLARGAPLKGVAMTLVGLLIGLVGTDVNSGVFRFTFGLPELADRVELVAIALGLFGVADFLRNINRVQAVGAGVRLRFRDMRPSKTELKQAFWPMVRGTLVGTLFGAMPGTGPRPFRSAPWHTEQRVVLPPPVVTSVSPFLRLPIGT